MKNILLLLIFILTMISGTCFAQNANDKINYIGFRFEHFRRINNHKVNITISKFKTIRGEVTVHVSSVPMKKYEEEYKALKIDTIFTVGKEVFVELINEIVPILNKLDVTRSSGMGMDGTSCAIEYGTFNGKVAYEFWSPDSDTEQRELTDFIRICKKIVEIGSLNSNKILGY